MNGVDLAPEDPPSKHISYQQAAELLSVPIGTLRSMVCRRQIPHVRISTRIVLFDVAALKSWLERCTVAAGERS